MRRTSFNDGWTFRPNANRFAGIAGGATEPVSDLAFVELTLVDEAATVVTTDDQQVAVEVDGPGTLPGLAGADPRSEEPFTGSTCTTVDGRAIAVIRPTGAATITVRASRDGGPPAELSIEAT